MGVRAWGCGVRDRMVERGGGRVGLGLGICRCRVQGAWGGATRGWRAVVGTGEW
jgi:hypothetical protein